MTYAPHDISDITSADQLISYACRAQLALIRREASQNTVAAAIAMAAKRGDAGANLTHALQDGTLSDEKLHKLDEVIVSLAPSAAVHVGGLSSLAIRLRGLRDRESLSDRVQPSWWREILQQPANNEIEVLTHASALLTAFLAAESVDRADPRSRAVRAVHERYYDEIIRVVDQLIIVGIAPPTPRNVEALIMLGTLGSYAFDIMKRPLEDALKHPLGFRVWRAITKIVKLSRAGSPYAHGLRLWVENLLEDAEELRSKNINPGRSLDLELAIAIPPGWSPPERDWAGLALLRRAANKEATIRERGTAAMGVWERSFTHAPRDRAEILDHLQPLLEEFESPGRRPDAYLGMQWVAATLRHVIARDVPVCNDWPKGINERWLRHVYDVCRYLELQGIPDHILPGTITLFRHSLLQNSGVYRRHAIEALLASGWVEPATSAFEHFIELEKTESWIRIRSLFALGFLQHRDRTVERTLISACHDASKSIADNPTSAQITEMHTVLFAIGDCFGASRVAEEDVRRVRDGIRDVLTNLSSGEMVQKRTLYPVGRALAYLLAFTTLPKVGHDNDLAFDLLVKLHEHPDEITRRLSDWALQWRLDESGQTRHLVLAKL